MDDALATTSAVALDRPTRPRPRHPLRSAVMVFVIACLVVSVGCWIAAAVVAGGEGVRSTPTSFALFAIGTAGPSLAALVAVLAVRGAPTRRTRRQAVWRWAPLAIVLPAAPAVVAELALGPAEFGSNAPAVVASTGGLLLFVASSLVAGPLTEEFGWRGFLQPRLRVRFGPETTALLVGVAWALWHVPLFLVPGTGQAETGLFSVAGLLFLASAVPLSFTFLLVSETLGGGVPAAILAHASVNVALTVLPQPSDTGAVITFATTCAIGAGACAVVRRQAAARRSGGESGSEIVGPAASRL